MALHLITLALACAYIVHCLILVEKDSHEGPFKAKNRLVVFPGSAHVQMVSLFDWVRRIFGVYTLNRKETGKEYWVVNPEAAERWECPFCLSFWAAIPFTIFAFVMLPELRLWIIPVHFALGTASTVFYGMIERALM